MTNYYFFDASALVKYYIVEPGSTCKKQLAAAKAEGFATDNPFDHISP